MSASLVGSEMCIRDSPPPPRQRGGDPGPLLRRAEPRGAPPSPSPGLAGAGGGHPLLRPQRPRGR
eukprot:3328172-Alexandrium_andersonii.AAC.1